VAEVYSPISGVLKAVNTYLENSPGLVNLDPVADGKCVTLPCYSTCYPVTLPATLLLYRLVYYFTFYLPGTYCNAYY